MDNAVRITIRNDSDASESTTPVNVNWISPAEGTLDANPKAPYSIVPGAQPMTLTGSNTYPSSVRGQVGMQVEGVPVTLDYEETISGGKATINHMSTVKLSDGKYLTCTASISNNTLDVTLDLRSPAPAAAPAGA